MLIKTKKILEEARKGNYAVAAFNINNMEIAEAVVEAANLEKAPIICETTEGAVEYAGMDMLVSIAQMAAKKAKVPIALHLDHGKNIEIVKKAISGGYGSVMYDGSSLAYEKNIANTKKIVAFAHKKGIAVEAELGSLSGIEDLVSVSQKDSHLTDPAQAQEFVKKTNCDFLAVAVGTSHGAYKFSGKSNLDFKRLEEIKNIIKIPLVLHGASRVPQNLVKEIKKYGGNISGARGLSDADLKKAVKLGINKVNTDTDLRLAFTLGVRRVLAKEKGEFDPRKILKPAFEEIVDVARHRIKVLGSSKKA